MRRRDLDVEVLLLGDPFAYAGEGAQAERPREDGAA
jgi:hypothetical protein